MTAHETTKKKTAALLLSFLLSAPAFAQLYAQTYAAPEAESAPLPAAAPIVPTLPLSGLDDSALLDLTSPPPQALARLGAAAGAGSVGRAVGIAGAARRPARGVLSRAPLQGRLARAASLRQLSGLNAVSSGEGRAGAPGSQEARIRSRYDGSAGAPALVPVPAAGGAGLGSLLRGWLAGFHSSAPAPLQEGHAGLYEVPASRLRFIPDPAQFQGTSDMPPSPFKAIGQERAMEALEFGLSMEGRGYNVFVTGPKGSGRRTGVMELLKKIAPTKKGGGDFVSVGDFEDPDNTKALGLPSGQGPAFQAGMAAVLAQLKALLPARLEEADKQQITPAEETMNKVRGQLLSALNERARQTTIEGFPGFAFALLQAKPGHFKIVLTFGGRPATVEDSVQGGLLRTDQVQAFMEAMEKASQPLGEELDHIVQHNNEMMQELAKQAETLHREAALQIFASQSASLAREFGTPEVQAYLADAAKFTAEHYMGLLQDEGEGPAPQGVSLAALMGGGMVKTIPVSRLYQVEILVSNEGKIGAPIVNEKSPTYQNVFGTIEDGKIKPGAILKANGGYLVLDAWETVRQPGVIEELMRVLKTGELEISDERPGMLRLGGGAARRVKVKVGFKLVLVGDSELLSLLHEHLPGFPELFKSRVQFDGTVDRSPETLQDYAAALARLVQGGTANLAHLSASGLAKLIEFSSRLADSQTKLATQFGEVRDLWSEASLFASQDPKNEGGLVQAEHVALAETKRRERTDLRARKLREFVLKNMFIIHTAGEKVGEINALAVSQNLEAISAREDELRRALGVADSRGRYFTPERVAQMARTGEISPAALENSYGVVMRLTAVHGASNQPGITWTDQKAGLIGPISTKALANINGFFLGRYARTVPLKAAISIAMEQEYNGIEGDSASLATTLAVISSLSGLPLRQDLAITGSMSQVGDGQVIGGENYKIEGFFDICKARGLTGTQGVVIPEKNLDGLQLRDDILQAVKAGQFHIYAVRTIDEAIEILTGVRAGQPDAKGVYSPGTVNRKVQDRLIELAKRGGV